MTVLSFCPSRSNIWILELNICNTLPVGRGLEADPTVKEAWVVERQRRESNLSGYFFTYLFTWKWCTFSFSLVYLPHLGTWGVSPSILYHKFQQLDYITSDIWKVYKFLAN